MGSARRALKTGESVACVLAVLLSSVAWGHSFEAPKHNHVSIEGDVLTVKVTYAIPPGDLAAGTRKLFDADTDGVLDTEESERLAGYVRQQALHFLKLELNRTPLALEEERREIKGLELPVSSGLEIVTEWVLVARELPLRPGRNTLVLQDRYKDQEVAVPVLVRLPGVTERTTLTRKRPRLKLRFQAP